MRVLIVPRVARVAVAGIAVLGVAVTAGAVSTTSPAAAFAPRKGGTTDSSRWLGTRTTDDGVSLRVTSSAISTGFPTDFNGVTIPRDCFPDRLVSVGVSTPRVAETVTSTFRSELDGTQVSAPTTGFAQPYPVLDREPVDAVQVVIVRTPKGAATVEASAIGWTDEAPVRGRYAVLARTARVRPGTPESPRRRVVRIVVRDADGVAVDRTTHSFGSTQDGFLDTSRPECQLPSRGSTVLIQASPPALPDAVGPPPADEDAARAAVTAAFEGAYRADGDTDAALTNVDGGDSAAVRDARQKASDANPQYVGRVTSVVTEIRFLDEREAAVRFEFRLDGKPFYAPQVGFAVLTPDGWKMTRSTFCDQLQTAGPAIKC